MARLSLMCLSRWAVSCARWSCTRISLLLRGRRKPQGRHSGGSGFRPPLPRFSDCRHAADDKRTICFTSGSYGQCCHRLTSCSVQQRFLCTRYSCPSSKAVARLRGHHLTRQEGFQNSCMDFPSNGVHWKWSPSTNGLPHLQWLFSSASQAHAHDHKKAWSRPLLAPGFSGDTLMGMKAKGHWLLGRDIRLSPLKSPQKPKTKGEK